jgi:hypothetical protein
MVKYSIRSFRPIQNAVLKMHVKILWASASRESLGGINTNVTSPPCHVCNVLCSKSSSLISTSYAVCIMASSSTSQSAQISSLMRQEGLSEAAHHASNNDAGVANVVAPHHAVVPSCCWVILLLCLLIPTIMGLVVLFGIFAIPGDDTCLLWCPFCLRSPAGERLNCHRSVTTRKDNDQM